MEKEDIRVTHVIIHILDSTVAVSYTHLFGASKVMGGGKAPQMMASTFPLTRGEVVEMLSVSGPVEGTDSVEAVSYTL